MNKFISLKSLSTILEPLKRLISHKAQDVDWNENNPTSPSYIANRTHYKSIEKAYWWENQNATFEQLNESLFLTTGPDPFAVTLENTNIFTNIIVIFDGFEYKCSVTYSEEMDCFIAGNTGPIIGHGDTGEPFCWIFYPYDFSDFVAYVPDLEHTISIYTEGEVVHKIPEEYLPELNLPEPGVGRSGEGEYSEVFNNYDENVALGAYSHAEGKYSTAYGDLSSVHGYGTTATHAKSFIIGSFNSPENPYGSPYNLIETYAESILYLPSTTFSVYQDNSYIPVNWDNIMDPFIERSNVLSVPITELKVGDLIYVNSKRCKRVVEEAHDSSKPSYLRIVVQNLELKRTGDIQSQHLFVVGNGHNVETLSNAHTLDWEGNAWYQGDVYVGGTSQDVGSKKLATEEFVNAAVAGIEPPSVEGFATEEYVNNAITNINYPVNSVNGKTGAVSLSASDVNAVPTTRTVNNKALSSDITLSASDVSAIPASMKGAINGVAELDSTGKILTSQLPAYVDDVLEYTTKNSFPLMGETGKIYVDLTTSLAWRWGGSTYVEISPSLALGETSSTAYRGDRGKIAYDHAQAKGIEKVNGFYKITTNSEGHITAANAVAQSDIVALGMATQDYVNAQIQEAVRNFITQAQMEAYVETSILGGEW